MKKIAVVTFILSLVVFLSTVSYAVGGNFLTGDGFEQQQKTIGAGWHVHEIPFITKRLLIGHKKRRFVI